MARILTWIKEHKLTTVLLVLVFFLISTGFSQQPPRIMQSGTSLMYNSPPGGTMGAPDIQMAPMESMKRSDSYEGSMSGADVANRMVTQDTTLSLLVEDVENVKSQILTKTKAVGGFMISSSTQNPEDAATSTISVRVPSTKLDEALASFKGQAVKVVTEYVQGEDVTDQYTDIEAQMKTLMTTKAKFEDILEKATAVQDILEVQRELTNLQSQIDALTGQQQYLEKNVQLSRVTIFLSTDELALPYEPNESWRPALIFKEAVRSLILTFRSLGSLVIWLAVYSVVWVPVLAIIYFWKRRQNTVQRV